MAFINSPGVPQIVPFEFPNSNPIGNSGDISQELGADPAVWPAIGCISVPFTNCMDEVGNDKLIPLPVTVNVKLVFTDPPVLLAQTV